MQKSLKIAAGLCLATVLFVSCNNTTDGCRLGIQNGVQINETTASASIDIVRGCGYTGPVNLSAETIYFDTSAGTKTGNVTFSFSPNQTSGNSSVVNARLSVPDYATYSDSVVNYFVTGTADNGKSVNGGAGMFLPDIFLYPVSNAYVDRGSFTTKVSYTAQARLKQYADSQSFNVSIELQDLPAGVSIYAKSTNYTYGRTIQDFDLKASPSMSPGTYPVSIRASKNGTVQIRRFNLIVR
jgi:hypothetical protein